MTGVLMYFGRVCVMKRHSARKGLVTSKNGSSVKKPKDLLPITAEEYRKSIASLPSA